MDYNKNGAQEKTDEYGIPEKLDEKKKVRRFSILKILLFIFTQVYSSSIYLST